MNEPELESSRVSLAKYISYPQLKYNVKYQSWNNNIDKSYFFRWEFSNHFPKSLIFRVKHELTGGEIPSIFSTEKIQEWTLWYSNDRHNRHPKVRKQFQQDEDQFHIQPPILLYQQTQIWNFKSLKKYYKSHKSLKNKKNADKPYNLIFLVTLLHPFSRRLRKTLPFPSLIHQITLCKKL